MVDTSPTLQAAPDTRERLIAAAAAVFAEHGFEAATVREICGRAEANVAAINYYFGGKRQLYAEIFDSVFRLMREQRTPFLPASASAEKRLRTYLRSLFEELFYAPESGPDCTHLSAIYLMEMARPTEVLDRVVDDYIQDDAEELMDIVGSLLGSKSDELTQINCAASVVGQALYYLHAKALIERLYPDLPPPEERLEALIEHVTLFSLGGLERIGKQAMNSER